MERMQNQMILELLKGLVVLAADVIFMPGAQKVPASRAWKTVIWFFTLGIAVLNTVMHYPKVVAAQ